MALRTIACAGLIVVLLSGCGGGVAAPTATPAPTLKAEVCKNRVEGLPGYDIQLFVRNLNDFEWKDATFVGKDFSNQPYRQYVDIWPPESTQTAEPLTTPRDFKTGRQPLTSFSLLTTLTITVEEPFRAEWTGDVAPCQ